LKFMDDNLVSSAAWAIADESGRTCSMLLPSLSTDGGWPVSSLSQWGQQVRKGMMSYDPALAEECLAALRVANEAPAASIKSDSPWSAACAGFSIRTRWTPARRA
jgi:hypothetical protein